MKWYLVEQSGQERMFAAKVSGGILIRYEEAVGADWRVQVTYVLGAKLSVKKKDGTATIVKGK